MLTAAQIEQFHTSGYVILDNAVEPGLMQPLRKAAADVTGRTRSGQWQPRRSTADGDIWGVQDLLHPDLGEPIFAEYMATEAVLEVCRELLGSELRLGLVNLLVNPVRQPFAIGWHRDLLRRELPPDQELEELTQVRDIIQWNAALEEEECLLIVPGSHRRASTPEEREVQFHRPMDPLPGQLVVKLKAGQGVYYDNMLIHRGIYPCDRPRATLHAALTAARSRPLEMYYTAVQWMERPGFRESLPPRLQPSYDAWLEFAEECKAASSSANLEG